jgi:DNA-binding CsgD family transcriptional regulator
MTDGELNLAAAERAWLDGDAERCLVLSDGLTDAADGATAEPLVLLRTRALLRLRREPEALTLLASASASVREIAESPAAKMLAGTAYVRSGELERGLALLRDAAHDADPANVTLCSEIALGIALARYDAGDLDGAETALDRVDARSDVVCARALELGGWIAKRRGDFSLAIDRFEAALAQLDASRQRDRFVEASVVTVLGNIAVELLDEARWNAMQRRGDRIAWDGAGMAYYHFWHEMNRSTADETYGRPRDALQAARSAAAAAPSDAFRIFAHCRRAAVLLAYDELLGYEDLAARIRTEFDAIDIRTLRAFEEVNLAAVVVATLALIGDVAGAASALQRLEAMSPEQRAMLTQEPLERGYLVYVEALVADASGDTFAAQHRYGDALRAFREAGAIRRAILAALRLIDLNADKPALQYVDAEVARLPVESWLRARAAKVAERRDDPLLAELTRAEREVLELLYDGRSTADIAAIRDRSTQTIRNTVSKLLKLFRVDSRSALITECRRRAIFERQRQAQP